MEKNLSAELLEDRIKQLQKEITELQDMPDIHLVTLNSSVDAIVRYDAQGHVQYLNPAFTKLFGWTFEELKGRRVDFVPKEALENTQEAIQRIRQGEELKNFSTLRLTKNGRILSVAMSVAPIFNNDGINIGNVVSIRDETEHREHERILEKAVKDEKAASKSKSDLLAGMSREITTLMNDILGVTDLMMDTDPDNEQTKYLAMIRKSSDELLSIINDILDFSKIEAGKMELELIDFDLRRALDEMISIPCESSRDKGLEFCYEIEPQVPSRLMGDPGRLRQIISHLLNYAVLSTSRGEVGLKVGVKEESDEGVKIYFLVKDTGPGIAKKDLGQVFNLFSRLGASSSAGYGGTGLGLFISKKLVDLMGGEIGVESEPRKGTQFWFTAGFKKSEKYDEPVFLGLDEIKEKRILVVDDNRTSLQILVNYVENFGLICDAAWSAEMAITMINAAKKYQTGYDVVITDFQMPGMDGAELGRRIKQDHETKNMTLIVLSSPGLRGDAAKMKEIGFNGYLTKPVSRDDLLNCMVMALSREKTGDLRKKEIVTHHRISEQKKDQGYNF